MDDMCALQSGLIISTSHEPQTPDGFYIETPSPRVPGAFDLITPRTPEAFFDRSPAIHFGIDDFSNDQIIGGNYLLHTPGR